MISETKGFTLPPLDAASVRRTLSALLDRGVRSLLQQKRDQTSPDRALLPRASEALRATDRAADGPAQRGRDDKRRKTTRKS
jgi:hypothetical protein